MFCDILTLKPSVDRKFALSLSQSITRYSRKFGFDPKLSVAIAMQESSFKNIDRPGAVLNHRGRIVRGSTDIGVFQLHIHTIANMQKLGWEIDTAKLRADVDYQAYWHARLLRRKIRECQKLSDKLGVRAGDEWSCYHSFTPSKRGIYLRLVGSHLARINGR